VGYCYGDTTCGQRVLYQLGMSKFELYLSPATSFASAAGIPIVNTNNACSTGSSALNLARAAVEFGQSDCTLALGFEVMAPGSIVSPFQKSTSPMDKVRKIIEEDKPESQGPPNAVLFANVSFACLEIPLIQLGTGWRRVRQEKWRHLEADCS
jgi:sterol carrier protein 2